jgi:hypothetical protein
MPLVMQLEGLNQGHLAEIRSRLNGVDHQSWWNAPVQLNGLFDPVVSRPVVVIGGLVLGMWLAGSATGKSLVKRYLPGKRR